MSTAEHYMERAIALSLKGLGHTHTNPLVGCVIVFENEIIGEGYHQHFGEAHAEVNAIQSVAPHNRNKLPESTLYVTLEPCCHFGKTPPCTDLILANKIPNVVIATLDPFEKVKGMGVKRLSEAGVQVRMGIKEKEAAWVNRRFLTFHTQKRPYIILKWAQTLNGVMIPENASEKQISGKAAQLLLHQWRSEEAAFMIGSQTLIHDNPSLTTRLIQGKNPVRIALASAKNEFKGLNFFKQKEEAVLISNHHQIKELKGAKLIHADTKSPNELMKALYDLQLLSLVVEGGRKLLDFFIQNGCFDEVRVFTSKNVNQKGIEAPILNSNNLHLIEEKDLGQDVLTIYSK